jgi:hypothetical protein
VTLGVICDDYNESYFRQMSCVAVNWIELAENRVQYPVLLNISRNLPRRAGIP